jgi:hypothetical protein
MSTPAEHEGGAPARVWLQYESGTHYVNQDGAGAEYVRADRVRELVEAAEAYRTETQWDAIDIAEDRLIAALARIREEGPTNE